MKMIQKFVSVLLAVVFVISLSVPAFAAETENNEYEGMPMLVLDDGFVAYYTLEEEIVPASARSRDYVSKTVSARFYLTSNDETVAQFSLSATFWYDGESVGQTGHRVWMGNYASGWSGEAVDGYNWISDQYMYISGYYYLYYNGEFNNSHTLTLYCDQDGNVTVVG